MEIDREQVIKAVAAIKKLEESKKSQNQNELFESDDFFYLVVSLKKVPTEDKKYFIELPHSYTSPEDDVCLFVRDPQDYYRKLLPELGVTQVKKIIGVAELKKKYKGFEERRKLHKAFKRFLADDRITLMLPKLIGKSFFNRSSAKFPTPVNMNRKIRVEKGISRGLRTTNYLMSTGAVSSVIIGKSSFSGDQINENIKSVLAYMNSRFPFGPANVQTLSIKTHDSPDLPIYISAPTMEINEWAPPVESTQTNGKKSKADKKRKAQDTPETKTDTPKSAPTTKAEPSEAKTESTPRPAKKSKKAEEAPVEVKPVVEAPVAETKSAKKSKKAEDAPVEAKPIVEAPVAETKSAKKSKKAEEAPVEVKPVVEAPVAETKKEKSKKSDKKSKDETPAPVETIAPKKTPSPAPSPAKTQPKAAAAKPVEEKSVKPAKTEKAKAPQQTKETAKPQSPAKSPAKSPVKPVEKKEAKEEATPKAAKSKKASKK